jgi:hypothetical protein
MGRGLHGRADGHSLFGDDQQQWIDWPDVAMQDGQLDRGAERFATVDRLRGRAEFVEQLVSPNFHRG